jgi:hypothetical protein
LITKNITTAMTFDGDFHHIFRLTFFQ